MAYRTASAARVTALDAHAFARERCERFLLGSMVTVLAALGGGFATWAFAAHSPQRPEDKDKDKNSKEGGGNA